MRLAAHIAGWTLVVMGSILMISPIPFGVLIIAAGTSLLAAAKRKKGARERSA